MGGFRPLRIPGIQAAPTRGGERAARARRRAALRRVQPPLRLILPSQESSEPAQPVARTRAQCRQSEFRADMTATLQSSVRRERLLARLSPGAQRGPKPATVEMRPLLDAMPSKAPRPPCAFGEVALRVADPQASNRARHLSKRDRAVRRGASRDGLFESGGDVAVEIVDAPRMAAVRRDRMFQPCLTKSRVRNRRL